MVIRNGGKRFNKDGKLVTSMFLVVQIHHLGIGYYLPKGKLSSPVMCTQILLQPISLTLIVHIVICNMSCDSVHTISLHFRPSENKLCWLQLIVFHLILFQPLARADNGLSFTRKFIVTFSSLQLTKRWNIFFLDSPPPSQSLSLAVTINEPILVRLPISSWVVKLLSLEGCPIVSGSVSERAFGDILPNEMLSRSPSKFHPQ